MGIVCEANGAVSHIETTEVTLRRSSGSVCASTSERRGPVKMRRASASASAPFCGQPFGIGLPSATAATLLCAFSTYFDI